MLRRHHEPEPDPPSMAESMAAVMDSLAHIREAVAGYRNQLEADGFSPTMAEAMAAYTHNQLIEQIVRST